MKKRNTKYLIGEIVAWIIALGVFVMPFLFMLFNSLKDRRGANQLALTLPTTFEWSNYTQVLQQNNYQVLRAFKNSFILMLLSVLVLEIGRAHV